MSLLYLPEELILNIQSVGSSFNSSRGTHGEYSRNPRIARAIDGIINQRHATISINKEQKEFLGQLLTAIQKGKYTEFQEKYGVSYNVALDIIMRMGHNHLFLYGPPGAGKISVGKELAKKLGLKTIDTDERIEQENNGKTIPEIITENGVEGFHKIESNILEKVLMEARERLIVSLGGGTLLNPDNLKTAHLHGTIIWITADTRILVDRVMSNPGKKTLINSSTHSEAYQSTVSLLTKREGHYGQFGNQFDSPNQSPKEIASRIVEMM